MKSSPNTRENQDVEIRKSSIHESGVFALREFQPGEIVLRWNLSQIISDEEFSSLPESERLYTHPLGENQILVVQPPERYVNHSCNNNTVVRSFCDIAIRHIAQNEEITSDYSVDGSGSKFKCRCGAEKCRGEIG